MSSRHTKRYPGETEDYRRERDELLEGEIVLRRQTEQLAALRRKLPVGAEVPTDYVFEEGAADLGDRETVRQVRLSELFAPGQDALVVYNFMYGPSMAKACPMCTSFLDSLDGQAEHIRQQVSLAVVAKSPIARIRDYARSRAWTGLRLLSSAANTYNADYFGEEPDGSQNPMMNVFVRRDGTVRHFWGSELLFSSEPGQNSRHIDTMWPLWNVLDLTPEGRGATWYPKISYEK